MFLVNDACIESYSTTCMHSHTLIHHKCRVDECEHACKTFHSYCMYMLCNLIFTTQQCLELTPLATVRSFDALVQKMHCRLNIWITLLHLLQHFANETCRDTNLRHVDSFCAFVNCTELLRSWT